MTNFSLGCWLMVSSYLNASLVGQSMFSRLFLLKNHMSFDVIHCGSFTPSTQNSNSPTKSKSSSHLHYCPKDFSLMANQNFQQSLPQAFSLTWSLRNQIWCQIKNISYYHHHHTVVRFNIFMETMIFDEQEAALISHKFNEQHLKCLYGHLF